MVIPVGREVRQRRLYGNLALYKKVETARDDYMATWLYTKKWKPPETTICKPGLTQVSFLHMAQQGDLHVKTFR